MLVLGLLFSPVRADEPEEKAAGETPGAKSLAEGEIKPSPIPRLAELRIDETVIAARAINLPIPGRTRTLQEVVEQLDQWGQDDRIGAVLLNVGGVGLSLPEVQELRSGIDRLRKKDKKVMAFLQAGGDNAYLLACAADEIATAPTGSIALPGIGRLFPFMKGHYQMQGLEFEVITAGKYKYPGFVNRREPDRWFSEEFNALFDSWFRDYKQIIAASRKLSDEAVSEIVDIALFDAPQAQQRGLIDVIAYYDEYRDRLLRQNRMRRYQEAEDGLAGVNSIQDLMEVFNRELRKAEEARKAVGPKIAVLHARGPIIDISLGAALSSSIICRDDMVKTIDELKKNKSIKAVVLHVDSPGGSGHASDAIWKALRELDDEKPLVVSMGSVAASGGYYIACPGRRIFAQPTTLTGSIGVIAILQSARSRLNRMDYELAPFERGARSLLGAPHKDMAPSDRAFIQKHMDDFYKIFLERVAQTRRIPAEMVDKIAQGRIWTGRDAKEIGLVDELGGITEAIEAARAMANIPPSAELKVIHYPRPSSLGELVFGSVGMTDNLDMFLRAGAPAVPMSFHDQLMMLSRSFAPLCWAPIPDIQATAWPAGAPRFRLVPDTSATPGLPAPAAPSTWQP
jgi:protease-4